MDSVGHGTDARFFKVILQDLFFLCAFLYQASAWTDSNFSLKVFQTRAFLHVGFVKVI